MNEENLKNNVNAESQDPAPDTETGDVSAAADEEFTFESPILRRELKLRMGEAAMEIRMKMGWFMRLFDHSDDAFLIPYDNVDSVSLRLCWRFCDLFRSIVLVGLMAAFPILRRWICFLITMVSILLSGSLRVRFQMKDGQRKTLFCNPDKRKELISALSRKLK